MDDNKSYKYVMPLITLIGQNSLSKLGIELSKKRVQKVLIVTDSFMCKSGMTKKVQDVLESEDIKSYIFEGVKPNPTIEIAKEAINLFLNKECDAIVSLGGGSAHDTAKAMKLPFLKGNFNINKEVVLAAINTTAGTGSEITKFCIITDEEKHHKLAVTDEKIVPDIAIDDPKLMINMPPSLTATTGMDALTHAIEAYTAVDRNILTDCTALEAIKLIFKSLGKCYTNGNDINAREDMVYAQYMAAMSFSNAGLGLTHGMSHQLSGIYNLPHGLCNAVLIPYVMEFNFDVSFERYASIAKGVGICPKSLPDNISGKRLIQEVRKLNRKLNIPKSIKELNVKEEDFHKLSEMAIQDICTQSNEKKANIETIESVYKRAYDGETNLIGAC